MHGLSLRQKLPLLACSLTAGALLVSSALAYVEVRQAALHSAETRLTSISDEFAALLDQSFQERAELQARVAGSRPVIGALTRSSVDTADLVTVLDSLRGGADGALPISLVKADGTRLFSVGADLGPEDPDPTPPLHDDRAFGPLRELGGRMLYWETFPVPDSDGEALGWIVQRRSVGGGNVFGALLGRGVRFRLGQMDDSVWIGLGGARAASSPDGIVLGLPYSFTASDGAARLAMARRVPETPWIVFLDMPMSQVLARPHAFRDRAIVFGGIIVLVVVFLAWLASRRLANPLDKLARAAEAIAGGEYGGGVQADGDDEVGRLSVAFNTMSERVARSEAALKDRLAEARALATELEESHRAEERARKEAQAANAAKADILASISHDIRTPLSAVLAYAELLQGGISGEPTSRQREYLARIDESARMIVSLVDDVLDFSCIEKGELRIELRNGCVHDVVRAAVTSVEPRAEHKRVSITSACAEGSAFLGDPRRVGQIVMNLLANAVKFTPEGGSIFVRCSDEIDTPAGLGAASRPWVTITVEDSGIGIPSDQLERIFDPFIQGEDERGNRSSHRGVGLGLAISRHLAQMMSGRITVDSVVGEGSRFTLWLPGGQREAKPEGGEASARSLKLQGETAARPPNPGWRASKDRLAT